MKAHPAGLTLDELSDELVDKPVSHADVEALIGAFEEAGIDLTGPPPPAQPEELVRVLAAVRAITAETGTRPAIAAIAARAELSIAAVQRALRLGRSLGP